VVAEVQEQQRLSEGQEVLQSGVAVEEVETHLIHHQDQEQGVFHLTEEMEELGAMTQLQELLVFNQEEVVAGQK
jgi:hypothetical protein